MNLLESYKGRLSVSEKYYSQKNDGLKMSNTKKMLTAQCLENTAKYLNESFNAAAGTQRSDMGMWKKFCLDITTITMPNLIVNDLFIVQPMSSFSGYITFMQYALGTEKGGVGGLDKDGNTNTIIQDPFVWSAMTEERSEYTGENVVDTLADDVEEFIVSWAPIVKDVFGEGKDVKVIPAAGGEAQYYACDAAGKVVASLKKGDRVIYKYQNQLIPQEKLPTVVGKMQGIALTARARRIGVSYSQFAAFQAKNDYGIDFESTIAQQAQSELSYEIDSEAVFMIKNAAENAPKLVWCDEELDTISYAMKAEGFARKLEQAKNAVYRATNRFMPNWMLISPEVMPILTFVPGFQPANNAIANGPLFFLKKLFLFN